MKSRDQRGVILVGALITMVFFMIVTLAIIEFATNHYAAVRRSLVSLSALAVAEAGGDLFIQQLNNTSGVYTGTGGEVILFNDSIRGKGTYQTSVTSGSISGESIITSIGRIYLPATSSQPLVTRKIRIIVTQSGISAPFTIQTGPGGLDMNNQVHIAIGPIYVGGKLHLNNNASIGSVVFPVSVYVQDFACPTGGGSGYPSQCTSSPPYSITLDNGTSIRGDVYATNGIDNPSLATNNGFVSSVVPNVAYPVIDHNTVTTAHSWSTSGSQNITCTGGVATIAANTRFTNGNGISIPNNCIVTVNGDVWVDKTITFGNNSALAVGASLTDQPLFIVDGWDSHALSAFITGNNNALIANAAGWGFEFLTFASFASSGDSFNSCSPGCTSVTGAELYNSQQHNTVVLANNFSSAAGTTFYSRWSGININNNTTLAQLIAQKITLGNNGTLIFQGNGAVSGGVTTWNAKYWEQYFK